MKIRGYLVSWKNWYFFKIYFQLLVGLITKKFVWLNLYSIFIFSILKIEFGYKKWKYLFNVFIFIENEYSDNFVNMVKTQRGPTWCERV